MKQLTVPQLVVKILGLVLVVIGLRGLPFLLYWFVQAISPGEAARPVDSIVSLTQLFPSMFYMVAGLIFFFASRAITNKIIISADAQISPVTIEGLQSVLYSAVGLYLAMTALSQFAEFISELVWMDLHKATSSMDGWNACRAIGSLVQLALGFCLFLGTKGVVGFRNRTREWGIKDAS